ncbi:hypothetical protein EBU71_04445 [bacterium]|nr:hypothetical protein [Candidatus Elulimicrobium humile]
MPLMTMDVNGTLITGRHTGVGHVDAKLYDHLQIRAWKVEVTEAGADLNDPASDTPVSGAPAAYRHSKRELLAQEFGTTGALIEFDATTMIFIGDSHALDSNVIARRADRCMGGTGALVNYINDGYSSGSGTGVTNPTGTVTTAKVAVTGLTSLFGV